MYVHHNVFVIHGIINFMVWLHKIIIIIVFYVRTQLHYCIYVMDSIVVFYIQNILYKLLMYFSFILVHQYPDPTLCTLTVPSYYLQFYLCSIKYTYSHIQCFLYLFSYTPFSYIATYIHITHIYVHIQFINYWTCIHMLCMCTDQLQIIIATYYYIIICTSQCSVEIIIIII